MPSNPAKAETKSNAGDEDKHYFHNGKVHTGGEAWFDADGAGPAVTGKAAPFEQKPAAKPIMFLKQDFSFGGGGGG